MNLMFLVFCSNTVVTVGTVFVLDVVPSESRELYSEQQVKYTHKLSWFLRKTFEEV